jgi:hypothetical protein
MDQRQAILEDVKMDLSGAARGGSFRRSALARRAGIFLSTMALATTTLVVGATAAQAGSCGSPDPKPHSQTYVCGSRHFTYVYNGKFQVTGNGTSKPYWCYNFMVTGISVGIGSPCAIGTWNQTACEK